MAQGEALVIGVSTFRSPVPDCEEVPLQSRTWEPLAFVPEVLARVRRAVGGLGYRVVHRLDPVRSELRDLLCVSGEDDGRPVHRIVHVVSHGSANGRRARLDFVPADGRLGRDTDVTGWISDTHAERRPTLFLIDLCGSGVAARLPSYLYEAGEESFAWVITASDGEEDAYDGRFSIAVAEVLEDLNHTGLGTDRSQEFVAFSLVARHIGMRLEAAHGRVQTVRATLMDPSAPEPVLPFFPNPAYAAFAEDPRHTLRSALDPPIRDFLEELDPVDARHFTDRPGRHFTGRRSHLRVLAPWLDDPDGSRLCVIVGSPGAGKSALLGALMCAAHPQLADQARHIRERLPGTCRPAVHEAVAAVQARQRGLETLLDVLARQLKLVAPARGWTPEKFVLAVRDLHEPPVIVLDALDEALDPADVTDRFLLPLTSEHRSDGDAVCRLLVGMRPWGQFDGLKALAARGGLLIDLDETDPVELEDDLAAYLDDALSAVPGYRSGRARPVRERLASSTAATLARTPQDGERWGEFLVASVFTSYLASTSAVTDVDDAARLGGAAPVTLPDVFELDLASRAAPEAVRALLAAIAHGKGGGIPAELAFPLASAFCSDGPGPAAGGTDFSSVLDESMFYLRTQTDTDGTTLYRPFHQGLADHLRARPFRTASSGDSEVHPAPVSAADRVLTVLLTPRAGAEHLVWAHAAPYLLRHAIEHAGDAGAADTLITEPDFLVHADPRSLAPALLAARTDKAFLAAAVYNVSYHHHRTAHWEDRCRLLALDAARYGATEMQTRFTRLLPVSAWQPRWAAGSTPNPALVDTLTGHSNWVTGVACTTVDGRPVAVSVGSDESVQLWDLVDRRPMCPPLEGHTARVTSVACTTVAGRPVAVTGSWDHTLRVWDLHTGRPVGDPLVGHSDAVLAVACTIHQGRPAAVSCSGRSLRVWDLTTGQCVAVRHGDHAKPMTAVACTNDPEQAPFMVTRGNDRTAHVWYRAQFNMGGLRGAGGVTAIACAVVGDDPVAVVGTDDGSVRVWSLFDRFVLVELAGTGRPVSQVVCTTMRGRPVAVVTDDNGAVRLWDLATRQPMGRLTGVSSIAVASTLIDDLPIVVTGSTDGMVQLWDPTPRKPVGDPRGGHTRGVTAIATTAVEGRPVAVTGSNDRTVRIWDVTTGQPVGTPLNAHSDWVDAVTCTTIDGRPAAVSAGFDRTVRIWDLTGDRPVGKPLTGHTGGVKAVTTADPGGRPVVVTGGDDRTVRIWDPATGELVREPLTGHTAGVRSLACAVVEGRSVVVSGSYDNTVRIWDLLTGRPVTAPLVGHEGSVRSVACAVVEGWPVVVSGSHDGTVRIWDLLTGRQARTRLAGHQGSVQSVACTVVEGRPVVVSGSYDRTVRIWDLGTGRCEVLTMPLPVSAVALSPDGALVIGTGSGVVVMERKTVTEARAGRE
ncbi:WD40 repeat domain-containing protein [Streptomyces violaceochromogenes]|uniref:WD40 repeat domain-containing protein n=1 Tax=Streptomyces violaceochromogenes TaxID=67377 RepID=A0ABU6LWV8_9ACTN|nr:WD40 repeat domain-containing protein [Streptomyces violaceochromogenes]MEC7053618.1 WD40 repeat domain-containing protein [Streptomyces violaceochromogenes]